MRRRRDVAGAMQLKYGDTGASSLEIHIMCEPLAVSPGVL